MKSSKTIKVYRRGKSVYNYTFRQLADKWYKVAFNKPNKTNPLMGDDINGRKSRYFFAPLRNRKKGLFIAGGALEGAAMAEENKGKVFLRRVTISTNTVILAAIANVILEPGSDHVVVGHNLRGKKPSLKDAFNAVQKVMKDPKVSLSFTVTGPYSSPNPTCISFKKNDLMMISTPKNDPTGGIKQDKGLLSEPKGITELFIEPGNKQHHAGWYACLQLLETGKYIMNIEGIAPYAGHGNHLFKNASLYEITVK